MTKDKVTEVGFCSLKRATDLQILGYELIQDYTTVYFIIDGMKVYPQWGDQSRLPAWS